MCDVLIVWTSGGETNLIILNVSAGEAENLKRFHGQYINGTYHERAF